MQTLLIVNCVLFLLFFVIWRKDSWLNLIIKTIILFVFLANSFYLLVTLGYIFKA